MSGAPVWQYFFDYVPQWRRAEQPNGAPHAAEIPYVFDTLRADRRADDRMTDADHAVARRVHSCWAAFAKARAGATSLSCADGFVWPARTEQNNRAVAIFQERPSIGHAADLRSPPNGAKPGPTSRDEPS
jgi:para-nitrobenzyl esterase